jgi:secondary thiamine-phosphate synthase enzyme
MSSSDPRIHGVSWAQTLVHLETRSSGFHIITREVENALPQLRECETGLLHLFIQHTSASLAINENADPDVRGDLQRHFERIAPRNAPYYEHTLEGPDDMPAHIKSVMIGCELTVPVRAGRLALGTWQGIYLCEHRDHAGGRTIVATLQGARIPPAS